MNAAPAAKDDALLKDAWRAGLNLGAPTLLGIAAWGMVVGVAMVKSGLTVAQAGAMTLFVFAGSAQLASLPLLAAQAPVWVIFATALVVNLRFVIFSVLLAPISPICRGASALRSAMWLATSRWACSCSATPMKRRTRPSCLS
ncbi:azaleucine resistance protein AzlC [Janthinobacterium lividum]|uniref:AzlC family ABC transporter permease n=1 Tax=Janthinobacterium lividum TaxID=29581 RepID=UPI000E07E941|nr:AzlC family ABC transporter permease [Janthinobacterium lividum]STR25629.1 azaleucine resistance protein AzlC [Janthinobacterium lividum]